MPIDNVSTDFGEVAVIGDQERTPEAAGENQTLKVLEPSGVARRVRSLVSRLEHSDLLVVAVVDEIGP